MDGRRAADERPERVRLRYLLFAFPIKGRRLNLQACGSAKAGALGQAGHAPPAATEDLATSDPKDFETGPAQNCSLFLLHSGSNFTLD